VAATALDALRTPEQAEVLLTLLRAHPELNAEAEWVATSAAHSIAAGVLQSLYDVRGYEDSAEHVLGGAGELAEYARQVTILLEELDIPLPHDVLLEVCPSWPLG
jgi:hypothetical protein